MGNNFLFLVRRRGAARLLRGAFYFVKHYDKNNRYKIISFGTRFA